MFAALFSIIPFFIISTKSYLYCYTLLNFSTAVAALIKKLLYFCITTVNYQLSIVNYLLMKNLYQKFLASTGVSTDTRNIAKGSIYFALKGASFNGNTFAWRSPTKKELNIRN